MLLLLPWALLALLALHADRRAPPAAAAPGPAPRPLGRQQEELPVIYAITPTYSRPVQKAELTRLANTFRQVARLHWVLVEDAAARTELVSRFVAGLARAGPPCTHLHVPTPPRYKRPGQPRATEQRNAGLAWIRQRHPRPPPAAAAPQQPRGVLFFADDDNTYSLELFHEVRPGGGGERRWQARPLPRPPERLPKRAYTAELPWGAFPGTPPPIGLSAPRLRAPPLKHPLPGRLRGTLQLDLAVGTGNMQLQSASHAGWKWGIRGV